VNKNIAIFGVCDLLYEERPYVYLLFYTPFNVLSNVLFEAESCVKNNIKKLSSYRKENTTRLHYKD
jgi:hypothetical protein